MNHIDKFGKPISVGDYVLYPYNNELAVGKVIDCTPKMVRITRIPRHVKPHPGFLVYADRTYLIKEEELIMYILKGK